MASIHNFYAVGIRVQRSLRTDYLKSHHHRLLWNVDDIEIPKRLEVKAVSEIGIIFHKFSVRNSSAYVGQTGPQFATRMKEHQSAVRRQDENYLLALHCLTTGHALIGPGPQ